MRGSDIQQASRDAGVREALSCSTLGCPMRALQASLCMLLPSVGGFADGGGGGGVRPPGARHERNGINTGEAASSMDLLRQ